MGDLGAPSEVWGAVEVDFGALLVCFGVLVEGFVVLVADLGVFVEGAWGFPGIKLGLPPSAFGARGVLGFPLRCGGVPWRCGAFLMGFWGAYGGSGAQMEVWGLSV